MTDIRVNKFTLKGRLRSFIHAFNGLGHAIRTQHNLWIHLVAGIAVTGCGLAAGLNRSEWCIIVLAMGLVISLEAMNTALEKLVDFISPGYEKQAGVVKDIAAGAVLVAAIAAVVAGAIIFIPKVL